MKNRYSSLHKIAKAGMVSVSLILAVVTVEWIVLGCSGRRRRTYITGSGDYQAAAGFNIGDAVSCNWRSRARRYNGTVRGKSNGRLYVIYADGDKEYIAPELCIKRGGGGAASVGAAPAAPAGRGLDKVKGETPAEPPPGGGSPPPSRPASNPDPAGEPDL